MAMTFGPCRKASQGQRFMQFSIVKSTVHGMVRENGELRDLRKGLHAALPRLLQRADNGYSVKLRQEGRLGGGQGSRWPGVAQVLTTDANPARA